MQAGSHEFCLFAPHVPEVSLVGSFTDKPIPLTRCDNGYWRVVINLNDGEHRYRFAVKSNSPFHDGHTVELVDPFARRIEKDGDDEWGVIVIEDGVDTTLRFDWNHDDKPLPPDDAQVIYELHVGEFGWNENGRGTFLSVIDRLDYLKELGVTTVELMPISGFPGDASWGYDVKHACAPDPGYGSPQDLKRLVDECHARGLRVLFDLVLNHAQADAPTTQIDFYYWHRDPEPDIPSYGAKYDYERYDDKLQIHPARKFGIEVALHWISEYHIDGYRLDATAILNNFDFLRELRHACEDQAGGKPFYLVAEHLPEDPTVAGPDAPVDGAWRKSFGSTVAATLCGTEIEGAQPSVEALLSILNPENQGYVSRARVVNYIESHDETTLMEHLGKQGILGEGAFVRVRLAATLLFTAVGNPMLFMGQEFGGHRPKTTEIESLQWNLLDADYGKNLRAHYAFLANIRLGSDPLRSEAFAAIGVGDGVVAFTRGGFGEVVVAANVSDTEHIATIPLGDGEWHELFTDTSPEITDGHVALPIGPWDARIWVKQG